MRYIFTILTFAYGSFKHFHRKLSLTVTVQLTQTITQYPGLLVMAEEVPGSNPVIAMTCLALNRLQSLTVGRKTCFQTKKTL